MSECGQKTQTEEKRARQGSENDTKQEFSYPK